MIDIRHMTISLFTVFAFSAIIVTSASATEILLAQWLFNGLAIVVALEVKRTVEFLYKDTSLKEHVICSWTEDILLNTDGQVEWTGLLTAGGTAISLASPLNCKSTAGSICEEAGDVTLAPEGTPWLGLAVLVTPGESEFDFRLLLYSAGISMSCLALGITFVDECTTSSEASGGAALKLKNVVEGVEAIGAETPLSNCTLGGNETGEKLIISGGLFRSVEGTLSISSE